MPLSDLPDGPRDEEGAKRAGDGNLPPKLSSNTGRRVSIDLSEFEVNDVQDGGVLVVICETRSRMDRVEERTKVKRPMTHDEVGVEESGEEKGEEG